MAEPSPPAAEPPEDKAQKPQGAFKLPTRVNPTVSFQKNLFGTAKPPQDLLFGRLSQPENFQYETATLPRANISRSDAPVTATSTLSAIPPPTSLPAATVEVKTYSLVAWVLALMLFLVGAAGSPGVAPLADTVKSAAVAILAFVAFAAYFWQRRTVAHEITIPYIIVVPATLCLYALASTLWSHAYLGMVEAIRYFIWILLIFLACNVAKSLRGHLLKLLWGIHLGGLAASFVGAMQFWLDVQWFAQGPNPASNFVNRNFAAEYVVMTLPISAYLIWQETKLWRLVFLTFGSALAVVFLMQTGTRAALLAFALIVPLLVAAVIVVRSAQGARLQNRMQKAIWASVFVSIVGALGMIPTTNASLKSEFSNSKHAPTAIARALFRYSSIQTSDHSLSVRTRMWNQTFEMFNAKPIFGVGAGAWEVNVPKYQPQDELRELDYYAHNEYLQLMAEYGLVGFLSLIGLLVYFGGQLVNVLTKAIQDREVNFNEAAQTNVLMICLLASLIAVAVTSLAGFPLHLAACGAMFAVATGAIAGLGFGRLTFFAQAKALNISQQQGRVIAAISALGIVLALHVSNEARLAEQHIQRATGLVFSVNYGAPLEMQATMRATHQEAVNEVKLGIAKNPHYRKITYLVADKLASIEDWNNAAIVYDSLLESRPYVPQLLINAAIAHERLRNYAKQLEYAERALKLRPALVQARSLELHALLGLNRPQEALARGRSYIFDAQLDDVGMVAVYKAAVATQDYKYAIEVLTTRANRIPSTKLDSLLSIGRIQFMNLNNADAALASLRQAWSLSDKGTSVVAAIPAELLPKVKAQ